MKYLPHTNCANNNRQNIINKYNSYKIKDNKSDKSINVNTNSPKIKNKNRYNMYNNRNKNGPDEYNISLLGDVDSYNNSSDSSICLILLLRCKLRVI